MSTSVDTTFVTQFEQEVHEAFQRQSSKLRDTIRLKTGVVGSSTTFQVVGTGTATTKARHGVITPMNAGHTAVPCTVADFYAGDWVDKLDELKINIDERMVVANAGAYALGRKIDSQVFTALDTTSQTVVSWVVSSAAAIRNSLINMAEALDSNDVPDDGERYCALSPKAWAFASVVEEWNSSDYVAPTDRTFTRSMQMKDWLGVKWMRHSGVPGKGTATSKNFLWHRSAVGYAEGIGVTSDITWHGDRASYFVNNMMSGGACLIEDAGVIEGNVDDTAALPTT
jgi:hypothetical protein